MKNFQNSKKKAMKKSKNIIASTVLTGALVLQAAEGVAQFNPEDKPLHNEMIRLFKVQIPDADLKDLRQRIIDTRWPDKETVADASQGAQLANLRQLVSYWGSKYNW